MTDWNKWAQKIIDRREEQEQRRRERLADFARFATACHELIEDNRARATRQKRRSKRKAR